MKIGDEVKYNYSKTQVRTGKIIDGQTLNGKRRWRVLWKLQTGVLFDGTPYTRELNVRTWVAESALTLAR
jgi:hypothetical protein